MAKEALLFIDKHMPLMKFRVIEFTNGGLSVGVTNKETNFRNAERITICNIDFFIRHHVAIDDSSQNEVERDGGGIEREHKKLFDGLSEDDLEKMNHQDFEKIEYDRMEYNAYKVSEEIAFRIDGSAAPGCYMKGYPSEKPQELFLSDHEYLLKYMNAVGSKRSLFLKVIITKN